MTDRREQIAFPNQSRYHKEPRPARHIPTREQLQAADRRQAANEADGEADPSYSGHSAGIHPENAPFYSQDLTHSSVGRKIAASRAPITYDVEGNYVLEEGKEYYDTRLPTSTRRYQRIPDVTTQSGKLNVVEHYHQQPLRAHRPQPPQRQERYTDEVEKIYINPHRRIHPLLWLGVFGMFLVLGWIGLNFVTSWYQDVQNDWTYGKERHFEINAIVGHGDWVNNPSHFTAENNNGQIIVIELPGGNVAKAKIYQIETVPGNVGNPPVKLSFQDLNGDGKLDMLVQIGDGSAMLYVTLFNNGTEFVSKL